MVCFKNKTQFVLSVASCKARGQRGSVRLRARYDCVYSPVSDVCRDVRPADSSFFGDGRLDTRRSRNVVVGKRSDYAFTIRVVHVHVLVQVVVVAVAVVVATAAANTVVEAIQTGKRTRPPGERDESKDDPDGELAKREGGDENNEQETTAETDGQRLRIIIAARTTAVENNQ